jgi:hypothetical protein
MAELVARPQDKTWDAVMRGRNALTSPAAGPIGALAAVVLAGALAGVWTHAQRMESQLKSEIAALSARKSEADLRWQAKLSACRQDAAPPTPVSGPTGGRLTPVVDGDAVAAKLARDGPQGFDVCARMEAADAAVLASLRAK